MPCSGEVLLADGNTIKGCALKVVCYDTSASITKALRELVALGAAAGKRHLVQGVAAIEHTSPAGRPCLCILTE